MKRIILAILLSFFTLNKSNELENLFKENYKKNPIISMIAFHKMHNAENSVVNNDLNNLINYLFINETSEVNIVMNNLINYSYDHESIYKSVEDIIKNENLTKIVIKYLDFKNNDDLSLIFNLSDLMKAIVNKNLEEIKKILGENIHKFQDIDKMGNNVLIWAAFIGDLNLIMLLVEKHRNAMQILGNHPDMSCNTDFDLKRKNNLNQNAYEIAVILKSYFPDYDQRIIDYLKSLQPKSLCTIL